MDEELTPAEVNAYLSDSCEELQTKIMQMSDDPEPILLSKAKKRCRRRERRAKIYAARAEAFHIRKDQLYAEKEARKRAERQRWRELREQEQEEERQRALQLFSDRMYRRARQYAAGAGYSSGYAAAPTSPSATTTSHACLDSDYDSDSSQPPLVPAGTNSQSDWDDDHSDSDSDSGPPNLEPAGDSSDSDSDETFMRDHYCEHDPPPPPPPKESPSSFSSSTSTPPLSDPPSTKPYIRASLLSPQEVALVIQAFDSPWHIHSHARDPAFDVRTVDSVILDAVCIAFRSADFGLRTSHLLSHHVPVFITAIQPGDNGTQPQQDDNGSTTEEEPESIPISATIPASAAAPVGTVPPAPTSGSESSEKPQDPHAESRSEGSHSSTTSETLDYNPADFIFPPAADKQKYYVVAVGPRPGIFATREQMIEQVTDAAGNYYPK